MSGPAVIIGATGGIGGAIADALEEEGGTVLRFGRSLAGAGQLDLTDEATIEAAAARVGAGPAPSLVVIATGLLHEDGHGPEKALKELDADWLTKSYAVNAIGPALAMKHFVPLLPKTGEPKLAVLSARVGSIGDNLLGGWWSYRMAKAALNMAVKNAAVESRRRSERSIIVGLHPGTVDTALSRPFQANVPAAQLFKADRAAVQLLDVLDGLKPKDSGKLFAWDGAEIPA